MNSETVLSLKTQLFDIDNKKISEFHKFLMYVKRLEHWEHHIMNASTKNTNQ